MDSIYKRKRIRLPKVDIQKFNNMKQNKTKKTIKLYIIIIITIITFQGILNAIEPIFDALCKDKAKSTATIICNEESTKILSNYKYDDLITIYRDKEDNITMIQSNITPVNLIISDVGEKIQKRIEETKSESIHINLGNFTGNKFLAGVGPDIPIKLSLVGNVETDLRSEFKSQGINQTIHRIYLQVDCKINILTPYNTIEDKISNQVLIAENIIVGKIPEAYYNLQGLSTENAIDIVE